MDKHTYNEADLLKLASQGDEQAFQLIFKQYWPQVYGSALRLTRSPESAKDLAQDVFLKLWAGRHKLNDVKKVDAYIYVISRNLIMDFLRKNVFSDSNMAFLAESAKSDRASAQETMECKELERALFKEIDKLPGNVGDVFRLKYVDGLTHQEIARRLNISVLSSKTYAVRAMQKIRESFLGRAKKIFFLLFALLALLNG